MKNIPISELGEIFKSSSIGINLWHLEDENDAGSFRLIFVNKAAEKAAGAKMTHFEATTIHESFPALITSGIADDYLKCVKTGKVMRFPDMIYGDENVETRMFSVVAIPLENKHMVLMFTHVEEGIS